MSSGSRRPGRSQNPRRPAEAVRSASARAENPEPPPALVVCATPIGNLEDVTLRVLDALTAVDVILCEDTRHTRKLVERHKITTPLLSYHRHNEAARTAEILPRLAAGERAALVSDAGLPGVSDPGATLVSAALDAGLPLTVIPGPSVVETALVASGYAGSSYRFAGFVPRRPAELRTFWETLSSTPEPVVAFESPRRLAASLAALAAVAPGRELAVCRELTKHYESVVRGPVEQILVGLPDPVRGEVTLVIAPAPAAEARGVDVDALARGIEAVGTLRGAGAKRSVAVAVVAALTGLPRNRLYDDSL